MKTFVTGAAGFIGQNLVNRLVEQGHNVKVLIRGNPQRVNFGRTVEVCSADILDADPIVKAMEGCTHVYHLAAYAKNWARNPETYTTVNVGGLRNVLDAALKNGIKRVVFTSTNLTMDPSKEGQTELATGRSVPFFTDYEKSKYVAEETVHDYIQRGCDVVVVNPTRVFGPGLISEANSVTKMISWYVAGKFRFILGDGTQIGNYGFIDDVVDGHIGAMEKGILGERYLLGGENVSFNELFSILSEESGVRKRLFQLPPGLVLAFSRFEEIRGRLPLMHPLITQGWTKLFLEDWAVSCDKAVRVLGYKVTPFRDALRKTLDWLKLAP